MRVLPDSSWVGLTDTNKLDARDIAEEIPNALTAHLRELAEAGIAQNLAELDTLIQNAPGTAGIVAGGRGSRAPPESAP